MLKTDRVIVVEGKYDAIKLANIIDAPIFRTDGFGIFKDDEKLELLRKLAESRGLLILTDSDSAGFLIRNYLKSSIPEDRLLQVFVPDMPGKERRKAAPGKEGKLGVEGIPDDVLIACLKRAGITEAGEEDPAARAGARRVTEQDFYEDGLSGGTGSRQKRLALQKQLALPERMTAKQLLQVINMLIPYDEYKELVRTL
ncbi:MAG: DUF4093 domain-containing protein [Clostridia bacterium]|nr:DUF4093 domain-containing protein [Clostridia bacterium]